jgi:3-hydroxyisobutyrate dehydrogenase
MTALESTRQQKGNPPMRIGFLGLGAMGSGMVTRLADSGLDVAVYNRSAGKLAALAGRGVRVASSPADAACDADLLLISLSTAEVVSSMLFDAPGALAAAKPAAIVADMSTVSPAAARAQAERIAETGRRGLDACVIGNAHHAREGELRFMIGGSARDIERILPVLDVLGKQTVHVGESGMGATAKVAMNLLMGVQLQALSEAVLFGEQAGLDRDQLIDMIAASGYCSPMLRFKSGVMTSRAFDRADFRLALMRKDLHLALSDAHRLRVPMPTVAASFEVLTGALNAGLGELDCAAVLIEMERRAGIAPAGAVTPADAGG